jgi:hypothetical protein
MIHLVSKKRYLFFEHSELILLTVAALMLFFENNELFKF